MVHDPLKFGFKLHYFRDLANAGTIDLRTVRMDKTVPLGLQLNCPACLQKLEVLATLIASGDSRRIRIGCCPSCGYIGYMDRPIEEWIVQYYIKEWDNARARDVKEEAKKITSKLTLEQFAAVHMAENFSLSRDRLVCDIGCGNGVLLKEFENIGFKNLVGVENSLYRARLTEEKYGFPVLVGNFESSEILRALESQSPVGIFFSFHVLEHVYSPNEVVKACSNLQKEGDYLIFAMPDAMYEPAIITFFWLPHLNAYTKLSLQCLFNKHGYEILQDNFTYRRLMVGCKKKANPQKKYQNEEDYKKQAIKRFSDWFFINNFEAGRRYRISWTSKTYHTDYKKALPYEVLDRMQQGVENLYDFFATRLFSKFTNRRSLVISPLESRFTSFEESPIEIQYDGDIELLLR